MALARNEQIIAALVDRLTAALVPEIVTVVRRHRVWPERLTDLPAVNVVQGDDVPVQEREQESQLRIDWEMGIAIEIRARAAEDVDTTLNAIAAAVHAAIWTDYTLGLGFVLRVIPGPTGQPEPDADGRSQAGRIDKLLSVQYRTAADDLTS